MTTQPMPASQLFGLDVHALTLDDVVTEAEHSLATRDPLLIGVVNAAKIVKLSADQVLRDSLLECDLLLADGQSVVWASRLLGRPLPERVAGIDLFEALLEVAHRDQRRIYLLGATPEVLARLCEVVSTRWPNAVIAGSHDGYFDEDSSASVARDIAEARADMLFLGMTTPKKENFIGRHGHALGVPILHGVGGSFDVMAGVTARAPLAWQRAGMEWAYRVRQEPRRLWKRYLTTNTRFLLMLAMERVHRHSAYTTGSGVHHG
ncbi:WecB/TagA/CpsF family glycosyltransferase [Nocardioides sp. JQ2195]|uniref:WecB/TagA/CpsF family glycosyltransferase n=1 Tax=Nocardioides sp. JQ2195 TaxID=2592334 RepID=UPI00143ED7F7|nr:WecB/TagA/CpsF family glycosyltransferase [Nocardioides sp. JQ2195]QIX27848.1 WecB/TagA/CpsF family glycosyltransferase [Nocardioides sp. JQ2195]